MSYALIELDTGNMVGFYPTERAALEDVLDSINRYGVESVDTLGLGFNDPAGPVRRIAVGAELARRALAAIVPAANGHLDTVRGECTPSRSAPSSPPGNRSTKP